MWRSWKENAKSAVEDIVFQDGAGCTYSFPWSHHTLPEPSIKTMVGILLSQSIKLSLKLDINTCAHCIKPKASFTTRRTMRQYSGS